MRTIPLWHPAFRNPINRLWTHTYRLGNDMFRTPFRQRDLNDVNLQWRERTLARTSILYDKPQITQQVQRCPIRIMRTIPLWHPAFRNPINRLWTHTYRLGDDMFRTPFRQRDLNDVNLQWRNRPRVRSGRKCLPAACTAPPYCPTTVLTKFLHAIRLTIGTARPRCGTLRGHLNRLCVHGFLIPTMHSDNHTQMCVLRIAKIHCMNSPQHPLQMVSWQKYAFRHALKRAIGAQCLPKGKRGTVQPTTEANIDSNAKREGPSGYTYMV